MLEPSTAVQFVKGIGPRLSDILAAKGIHTVDDLLHYLPFRYEDRLNPRGISELRAGEMATVIAEVRTSGLFRTRRMPIFLMTAGQGRSRLRCIWFNGTYLKDKFQPGQMVALYGKVEDNRGELELRQPQFEIIGEGEDEAEKKIAQSLEIGRIVPIYESAGQGRLTSRWFRRAVHGALENLTPELPEAIPSAVRKRLDLLPPRQALQRVHWPDAGESIRDLVAFEAAIIAIENGYQVALMAPTEILAQQHYFSARRILEPSGYRIVLLTGSLEDDRKRDIRRHIAQGSAQLVIGTHALIEQKVEFAKLGLVIVDEQHRFGVLQRFKLMKKTPDAGAGTGAEPDVLVMTATPIPRTLALTLYGDLDI